MGPRQALASPSVVAAQISNGELLRQPFAIFPISYLSILLYISLIYIPVAFILHIVYIHSLFTPSLRITKASLTYSCKMRFTNKTVLALLAQAFVALAADNSFNVPEGGYNATAGQSLALSWSPTTSGTVSLILRSGASSDLDAGTYIAQNIQNR